jgi:hypothetical protein
MKTLYFVTAFGLMLIPGAAFAQAPPPAFVPYSIDEPTQQNLIQYLGEQPYKIASPIIQLLTGSEQRAQAEAARKEAAVPTVPVVPTAPTPPTAAPTPAPAP